MILLFLLAAAACNKKASEMEGPTIGSLDILADETLRYIIEQEEEIFERNYKYADVNISYVNEYDLFEQFMKDSSDAIFTTRALTEEEISYLNARKLFPRQFPFATGAIAFITNKTAADTNYTYQEMISLIRDSTSGIRFVLENVKSGITQEILRMVGKEKLPPHFYALKTKNEVWEYIKAHEQSIGVVDYSDISDSDNPFTRQVLESTRLVGISRPPDSVQFGFVRPFQYNLQDWKYPFTRDLHFITKTGKSDVGIGFASFICGEIGQKIILKAGLLPKYQTIRTLEINHISDIKVVK